MLDTRHVQTFAEVVRTGSFAGAARTLGYTQPAISQQMKALERAVGTPLFLRGLAHSGRRLRLTDAGRVLSRHADAILGAVSSAQRQMTAITQLAEGRIRVCAFPSANAALLPPALAALSAEHPGIRVELQEAEPPESLDALVRGDCDIAVAFRYGEHGEDGEPSGEDDPDLLEVPLLDDPLAILVPRLHPLAGEYHVDLARLAEERWIAGCPRCRRYFLTVCARAGFTPDIVFGTDDNLAVQSLVAAGAGVAFMPAMVLRCLRHPEVLGLPVLPPVGERLVSAYTLTGHQDAPVVRLLLDALRKAAGPPREGC